MAENHLPLAQILAGISGLKTQQELDVVRDVVKELSEKLKNALANGNSAEMILVNKEKYDYSEVKGLERLSMAEKWFKAPKPSSTTTNAYHHWRVWNYPPYKTYKGGLIFEKATGKSDPPETPECESEPEWESEDQEEETEEVTVAMAAVRVE
jgi:hypothetical protein